MKQKAAVVPALSTEVATRDDEIAAAVRCEHSRYERVLIDFEVAVVRQRDALRNEHVGNLRTILGEAAE